MHDISLSLRPYFFSASLTSFSSAGACFGISFIRSRIRSASRSPLRVVLPSALMKGGTSTRMRLWACAAAGAASPTSTAPSNAMPITAERLSLSSICRFSIPKDPCPPRRGRACDQYNLTEPESSPRQRLGAFRAAGGTAGCQNCGNNSHIVPASTAGCKYRTSLHPLCGAEKGLNRAVRPCITAARALWHVLHREHHLHSQWITRG